MDPSMRRCYARYLRVANKAINDYYTEKLKPTGVAIGEFSVLYNVSKLQNCGVTELADAMELDYSTVTRAIKPLLARGLLEDDTSVRGRKRNLFLTDAGKRVVEIGYPLWEEAQAEVQTHLGIPDTDNMKRILQKLEELR